MISWVVPAELMSISTSISLLSRNSPLHLQADQMSRQAKRANEEEEEEGHGSASQRQQQREEGKKAK